MRLITFYYKNTLMHIKRDIVGICFKLDFLKLFINILEKLHHEPKT